MSEADPLRILLANTLDQEGGAEQVVWSLLQGCRARGHDAWLAVGVKRSRDPHVLPIDHTRTRNPWARFWWRLQQQSTRWHGRLGRWGEKLRRGLALVAAPQAIVETWRGYENSHFPGTYGLLDLPPRRPDILHLHSLQRGYFELEALPQLSHRVPTVLTLHDAWLLSGHCTHPFGCERWRTGCGECPDLAIPPAIRRDATARNWQRKADILRRSRLWVAADSRWLLDKVKASLLTPVEARVIAPGVDLRVFAPGDRLAARAALGIPPAAKVLCFVAHRARVNPWKDFALLRQVMARLRAKWGDDVILVVGGDPAGPGWVKEDGIWLAPPWPTAADLAHGYRAADLYVHATHVETFGLTVVEAMASGLPVVATRTAALPELFAEGEAGYFTAPGDAEEMAARIDTLLAQPDLRAALGARAAQVARRFDVDHTVDQYVDWYRAIRSHVAEAG